MEMSISFIIVAMWSSAIYVPVKKFKSIDDIHKAMEIFGMQIQNVHSVCGLMTTWTGTMVMLLKTINTIFVGTNVSLLEYFESIYDLWYTIIIYFNSL
jgi:hypothetical protein